MRKLIVGCASLFYVVFSWQALAQVPDGKNEFRLAAVNARKVGLDANAGRGVWVAHDPDLDGDGKPEILVTTYSDGGRIFVFEVTGNDQLEFVWASKQINPGVSGGGSSPRSVVTGDIDNNGRQEIIFNVGNAATDTLRGIYIYEHDGVQGSDKYGTEPVKKIWPEMIDPAFSAGSVGITESGWLTGDIDGDLRNELVWCPRSFASFNVANVYIIQVKSGEWRTGNAQWEVEYKYDGMANALPALNDGYVPVGVAMGDIDNDGKKELVITGWVNKVRGGGIGFFQVNGPDSYQAGSVIPLTPAALNSDRIFIVKAKPLVVNINGLDNLFIQRYYYDTRKPSDIITLDGVVDEALIDESNIKVVLQNHPGIFSIWGVGDQDHGTGSDGFDFYLSTGGTLVDYEYNGTGAITDSASYTLKKIFDISSVYTSIGGLFDEIFVFPGMDLDKDGNREIVASWKGSEDDAIDNTSLGVNSFNIFVFEWGDSTKSIDLKALATGVETGQWQVITPEDYELAQNYPNPFGRLPLNPSTTIEFTLPLQKLISLRIYDTLGREVRTLIAQAEYGAGRHAVLWDGKDNAGREVASGQYIYRLEFGGFVKSRMMTLVK
ncbi:MAG: FG-GAP-like repeat-containing protein [candidate division KSB1 bacterium]|nr:FG-GAP-like repeat-containing protein [candidate division KSB1 bacterium]